MSLEEIKSGVAGLPQEQQERLAAYLCHLRRQRDAGTRREITTRIDAFGISPIAAELKGKK